MAFQVDTKFDDGYAFAFKELLLEQSMWPANEDFPAIANHAVPRNAFSRRGGGHGASSRARSARQAQSLSQPSVR